MREHFLTAAKTAAIALLATWLLFIYPHSRDVEKLSTALDSYLAELREADEEFVALEKEFGESLRGQQTEFERSIRSVCSGIENCLGQCADSRLGPSLLAHVRAAVESAKAKRAVLELSFARRDHYYRMILSKRVALLAPRAESLATQAARLATSDV